MYALVLAMKPDRPKRPAAGRSKKRPCIFHRATPPYNRPGSLLRERGFILCLSLVAAQAAFLSANSFMHGWPVAGSTFVYFVNNGNCYLYACYFVTIIPSLPLPAIAIY
jgi:hypothetical protein